MLLGQHCSMLSTILFGIVTPDCGLIQAQQYCSILLTTRNNVSPTTLLHPVFNNLLQLIIFCRVPQCQYYQPAENNAFVVSTSFHAADLGPAPALLKNEAYVNIVPAVINQV